MAGIYVHIPFCNKRCSYCDFHFSTTFHSYRGDLINSLLKELVLRRDELRKEIVSVYFGGGTPSLLYKEELMSILETIKGNYSLVESAEITLEANPEDCTEENLYHWKELGINRLSIGIQSFKPKDLLWMNRGHGENAGVDSFLLARKCGFKNISVDLMYGLPELTNQEWENHLIQIINLQPEHISAYCLTIEDKTALSAWVKSGKMTPPAEDKQSDQFETLIAILALHGYEQYEISNFAKESQYAIHNSNYWKGSEYMGIGPSAHSYDGINRRWNVSNNQQYIKNIGADNNWFTIETLSTENKWNELFLTGLRTKWGVLKTDINQLGGFMRKEIIMIEQLLEEGLLLEDLEAYKLSISGKIKADGIASDLFRI